MLWCSFGVGFGGLEFIAAKVPIRLHFANPFQLLPDGLLGLAEVVLVALLQYVVLILQSQLVQFTLQLVVEFRHLLVLEL